MRALRLEGAGGGRWPGDPGKEARQQKGLEAQEAGLVNPQSWWAGWGGKALGPLLP